MRDVLADSDQISMRSPLSRLVNPQSVAIIGASDRAGSLGARTVENLLDYSDFGGDAYLINPSRERLRGHVCYRSVSDLPAAPDVALLVVPAAATIDTLHDCAERGVRNAIVFTSGFGEVDEAGREAERAMARIARNSGMRIYGPNCPGLCNQNRRIGMMFSPAWRVDQRPGPIGLATQGGGIGRCFLQASDRGVGVGLFVSTGNEVDLTIADFIDYMADADDISVIATAIEGVRDGGAFLRAALRAAERNKPLVVLKVGASEYGAKAVASHTGSISGAAEVSSAAFRQVGALEVSGLDELIDTAALLARARPNGMGRVAIYSFSGGNCVMAADDAAAAGLDLAKFSEPTIATLKAELPGYAAINNPVDLTSDVLGKAELGYTTLKAVADDPNVDIVIYPFPCDYEELTGAIADAAVRAQRETETPILPIWLTDRQGSGWHSLVDGGLVPMRIISQATKVARRWIDWGRRAPPGDWRPIETGIAGSRLPHAIVSHSEHAAKAFLRSGGIPVPAGGVVTTSDAAVALAERLGFPVVAKIASAAITHKSDIGGVEIGLRDAEAVRAAFERLIAIAHGAVSAEHVDGVLIEAMAAGEGVEMLIGITRDAVFGPVMTIGLGGIYVELFKDVSRRLLPLTADAARSMVMELRCATLLNGARGRMPLDIAALVRLLCLISDFFCGHGDLIEELEINPVRVSADGAIALDAVLVTSQQFGNVQ